MARSKGANACRFRFYGDLNFFLPDQQRGSWIDYALDGEVAVKHPIESLGVPHPEVEHIQVDGILVGFGHRLRAGEEIRVYPLNCDPSIPDRAPLRPPLRHPPCFVVDTHLGRLAAYLRMAGFDVVYCNDFDDATLAGIACDEDRVLLTRDRGLLKRKIVVHGYCVRQSKPRLQFVDIARRYGLADAVRPWSRCIRCNGLLSPVSKNEIVDRLEPKTKLYYDEFQRCTSCGQIYWRGSHHERMRNLLDGVLAEARIPGHSYQD